MEDGAATLQALARDMKAEVDAAVAAAYGGGSAEVKAKYDESLQQAGVDPIKAPTEGGNVNLRKQYEDLMNQRTGLGSGGRTRPSKRGRQASGPN